MILSNYEQLNFHLRSMKILIGDICINEGVCYPARYTGVTQHDTLEQKAIDFYTGWSPMDKDLYAPITVDVIHHNNQNLTVELHWDKLKEINMDSD